MLFLRHIAAVIACAALLAAAPAVRAADDGAIDAESQIKKCWDLSLEKRSQPNNAVMRDGHLDTVLCLEKTVEDLSTLMFTPKQMSRNRAKDLLRNLRFSIGPFYWSVYNEHRGCVPSCGTMWQSMHLLQNSKILEELIRNMAGHWAQYPPRKR